MSEGTMAVADILLVEDNPGDVRLTREALDSGSIPTEVHVVENGDDALDFLFQRDSYSQAPRPAIVLLDLNIPRRDGFDILEAVHEESATRRIPVIVLTSSEAEPDVRESYEHCANGYVTKPVDPDRFIETIHAVAGYWLSTVRLPDGQLAD